MTEQKKIADTGFGQIELEPTCELRFIVRGNEKVLQQKWTGKTEDDLSTHIAWHDVETDLNPN